MEDKMLYAGEVRKRREEKGEASASTPIKKAKDNDDSKGQKSPAAGAKSPPGGAPSSPPTKAVSPIWQQRLTLLTDGAADEVSRAHFDQFGDEYGALLWAYFTDDDGSTTISLDRFAHKATPLFNSSTDIYVQIAGSGEALLRIAGDLVECVPVDVEEADVNVLHHVKSFGVDWNAAVVREAKSFGVDWNAVVVREAVRVADVLQLRFHAAFSKIPVSIPHTPRSDIVSPFCMFFLRASIPPSYLPPQNYEWSVVYSYNSSLMSTTGFERNVFSCKSGTLVLIRTKGGGLFALGVDEEWRNSTSAFGGPDAFCVRLAPTPIERHVGATSLFCNLQQLDSKTGIWWKGGDLDLDKDLSQVLKMEVWACGGSRLLKEHENLNVWEKNQKERPKKKLFPMQNDRYDDTRRLADSSNAANDSARGWAENGDGAVIKYKTGYEGDSAVSTSDP